MDLAQRNHTLSKYNGSVVYWARDRFELTPGRITLIYVAFGLLALYFSDVLLVRLFGDPLLSELQALKGFVEVLVTGGLIFGLTTALRGQVEHSEAKVARQREELLVLHRVLRHNLRNDLNVLIGRSQQLQESSDETSEQAAVGAILRTATKMFHYTEQAERIRQVSSGDGSPIEEDLSAKIPAVISSHPLVTNDVDVHLDIPENVTARVNRMLDHAIEELIRNAIEHNERSDPRVEITVDPVAGPMHFLEIRISDNGPGIPDRVVSILEQSEYDQLTHLQGMGLWFVHWVAMESDGRMIIEETEAGGASVGLQVPKARLL